MCRKLDVFIYYDTAIENYRVRTGRCQLHKRALRYALWYHIGRVYFGVLEFLANFVLLQRWLTMNEIANGNATLVTNWRERFWFNRLERTDKKWDPVYYHCNTCRNIDVLVANWVTGSTFCSFKCSHVSCECEYQNHMFNTSQPRKF